MSLSLRAAKIIAQPQRFVVAKLVFDEAGCKQQSGTLAFVPKTRMTVF